MDHHHHHENRELKDHGPLPTREKLGKLLEYWIKHNEEHAGAYLEWSKCAGEEQLEGVASLLEEAAEMTISINQMLKESIKRLFCTDFSTMWPDQGILMKRGEEKVILSMLDYY